MLTITTFDWVPELARGYVRDLRVRWTCEEAGLPYRVDTVPFRDRTAAHLDLHPFHQVPILRDGDLTLFETGAIVLHLAEGREALMPEGQRPLVTEWVFAALNSIEPWIFPWLIAKVFNRDEEAAEKASGQMNVRLGQLDRVLSDREWLVAGRFTAADLMMADVVRILGNQGKLEGYPAVADHLARATARPAFIKARADQLAHFAAAQARAPAA